MASKLFFLAALVTFILVVGSTAQNSGRGICSWYGAEGEIPQGWFTACGTGFDRNAMNTAHPSLPCGTVITVTNEEDGKELNVTVDDRGPFTGNGRILDLTYAAFGAINNDNWGEGLINCSYVVISSPSG